MEEDGGAVAQTNNSFARKLGSADKKTRDKGMALLVLWLSCQQDITEDELKKIWKGLFYCVWHSDKAPVQADLISRLAGILESLELDVALTFFKVFLSTLRREWGGIDRLRLDKFYLLLRQFLVKVFVVLQKRKWDEEIVGKFTDALVERALLASDEYPALGINLHLMDILLEELRKFQPLSAGTFRLMLEPCFSTIASAPDKSLLRRIKERVFDPLLGEARTFIQNKQAGEMTDDESFGLFVIASPLGVRLFDIASSESTPQANRKLIYEIHAEYIKLEKLVAVTGLDLSTLGASEGPSNDMEMGEVSLDGRRRHSKRNIGKKKKEEQMAVDSSLGGKKRNLKEVLAESKKLKDSPSPKVPEKNKALREGKIKKGAKRGSVKQQGRKENGDHLASRESEDSIKRSGTGLIEMVQNGIVGEGSPLEKKKKLGNKVLTEISHSQLSKQKKADQVVEVLKSSHVQAVQTGGTVEVVATTSVVTNVVTRVEGAPIAGDQVLARLMNSPLVQSLDESAGASGMRDADMLLDVSVDDSVISNLEKKFASIAAQVTPELDSTDLSGDGSSSLRVSVRKKRKRGNKVDESDFLSESTQSAGLSHSPSSKVHGGDQTPGSNSSKKKKVRFSLKNNIVWKPHNPLPPQSMRTPPSATPRGSALKKGVPAGPIRVTPVRRGLGSSPRRRSPKQILSMSLQKPSRSPKSLSKGPRFTRRVRKSPSSL